MPKLDPEWLYFSLINGMPAAVAALLFLATTRLEKRFAWDVAPRQSGIFFGASFVLRAALFVHVILASNWGQIRWLVWGNTVYAAVLLLVTMVWGDLFKWRRPIAILWLFLYIEEPVWMLTLVPEARAAWVGQPPLPGGDVHFLMQLVLWIEAMVMLVAGVYLFFLNRSSGKYWPWQPDPVSHRIMAGFPLAGTAWTITLAWAESWGEAKAGVLLNIIWLGALLATVLIFRSQFDLSRHATRIYVAVMAAFCVLLLILFVVQELA